MPERTQPPVGSSGPGTDALDSKDAFCPQRGECRHAFHDVGLAMGNVLAQATAMGLYVHQMAGFDQDAARQRLGIPEEYEPVTAIALGYPGDPDDLPEDLRRRELAPRERKPVTEFVFSGRWGRTISPADDLETYRGRWLFAASLSEGILRSVAPVVWLVTCYVPSRTGRISGLGADAGGMLPAIQFLV